MSASLGLPIPLGRQLYPGELHAAVATEEQARAQLAATELRVEVEVRQAVARYDASVERLELYTGGVLSDADKVLEATLYNYQRGGATLLEVLDAQRTDDEVYLAYYLVQTRVDRRRPRWTGVETAFCRSLRND